MTASAGKGNSSLGLSRTAHDVNGQDPGLMAGEQVIDEIADDRVWLMAELCHHAANQSAAPPMPFQINCAVNISRAMNFRPTMRAAGLLRPDFNEAEFLLQLRIAHDLASQRSATGRDHLDHGLHLSITLSKSA
jgi:hypothetical protein